MPFAICKSWFMVRPIRGWQGHILTNLGRSTVEYLVCLTYSKIVPFGIQGDTMQSKGENVFMSIPRKGNMDGCLRCCQMRASLQNISRSVQGHLRKP
jgi:hypothetical protein